MFSLTINKTYFTYFNLKIQLQMNNNYIIYKTYITYFNLKIQLMLNNN